MRIIAPLLIALFAIMGIAAAAIDQVEIIAPQDGDVLPVNELIKIKSMSSSTIGTQMFGRMFLNEEPLLTSQWTPTEPGTYTIAVEFADNLLFANSAKDEVTITIV